MRSLFIDDTSLSVTTDANNNLHGQSLRRTGPHVSGSSSHHVAVSLLASSLISAHSPQHPTMPQQPSVSTFRLCLPVELCDGAFRDDQDDYAFF